MKKLFLLLLCVQNIFCIEKITITSIGIGTVLIIKTILTGKDCLKERKKFDNEVKSCREISENISKMKQGKTKFYEIENKYDALIELKLTPSSDKNDFLNCFFEKNHNLDALNKVNLKLCDLITQGRPSFALSIFLGIPGVSFLAFGGFRCFCTVNQLTKSCFYKILYL